MEVAGFIVVGFVPFMVLPGLLIERLGSRPGLHPVLPWLAWTAFSVSWFLPNPDLDGRTNSLVLHLVGGGAATALAAIHVVHALDVERPSARILFVLAATSTTGVAAEIVELGISELGSSQLAADTSWDLLANTVGSLIVAGLVELVVLATATHPSAGSTQPSVRPAPDGP
ncbi:MAG: hypothetical protein ACE5GB_07240 [Acidimicrobiales bacterium]